MNVRDTARQEPVRVILDLAAVVIATAVFVVLLFGWGVEQHDPLQAATVAAVIGAVIVGAAEAARNRVTPASDVQNTLDSIPDNSSDR